MSLNTVCLEGRLTRDPNMGSINNKTAVADFSLAVQRNFKNKSTGEYDADFPRCKAFGGIAEFMGNYCHQGDAISVVGELQTRTYQDQQGQKHFITEVNVSRVNFTPTNKPKPESPQEPITEANRAKPNDYAQPQQKPAGDPFKSTGNTIEIDDDDLPF